ncbi:uncharacterized protein MYCFIDRAFT_84237 [Pseudocercospora fijiensis CIRAD86]|uniref:Methyltransferase type 11 domain-containing protein n=1 Tax=Pseudocercospora fijiensis (strain CIRAD86) TaxID=383855 RepID=N1Q8D0_PSEFD|nr:uncharacterized protein MYCFIDRAFT_84237 [Pseudocercospora fijiensis CIRAD86]EME87167.1 hypothetical protein MYCFIDRAFT_84237 [Pseudocercospora fijiensis CIRAD86]
MATAHLEQEATTTNLDLSKKSRDVRLSRRISTAVRSFRVLKNLTPEQVDNFMKSYQIYSLDWADEKLMLDALGPNYQKKVGECLADYYSVLNHLCALGEVEKMYIPPAIDLSQNLVMNQILYEERIANELKLPPNAKVLELGCGRGRVAAHISRVAPGTQITGLNIDPDQITSAKSFNKQQHLSNHFQVHDFNDLPLPLPTNHFDSFYEIQAFSLAKDHTKLFQELYRVLKPGARLSILDYVSLPAYDPTNPHHQTLMQRVKPLLGAVGTPTPQSIIDAMETAGFEVLEHSNASTACSGLQAPLIEKADGYFKRLKATIVTAVRMGLLPPHFNKLFHRLTQDCDAFIEADRARLITTAYHWLAVKPKLTDDSAYASLANSEGALAGSSFAESSSIA